jgi:tetratricopeptide (TPR) repeat protein
MKKYFGFIVLVCCLAQALPAQEFMAEDDYYLVYSDKDEADAAALAEELELRLSFYNKLFHFDPMTIQGPLQVRAISDQEAYDAYVSDILGDTAPGAVYVHYSSSGRRELIIHRGSDEEEAAISHQAFIQFLRSFIPNPPSWMRDGFAVFFSTLNINHDNGQLQYTENLDWLETMKSLGNQAPSASQILMADIEGAPDNFPAASWSLASFFLNSGNEDYFRILGELFMVLSPDNIASDNALAVSKRLNISADMDALERDYRAYIMNRQTFPELIASGRTALTNKNLAAAEQYFSSALEIHPRHFAPHYYLGLLAYEIKNYETAERYYQTALDYGADAPLVRYALGLNAAAAGRPSDAVSYLEQAASGAPDRYGEKARELISRIK